MKVIIILVCLVFCILVYWKIPFSFQYHKFLKQMEECVNNTQSIDGNYTENEIATLPAPLQRYCKYIGLEGTKKHGITRTLFKNTKFIFDDNKGVVLNMDYDLWLFEKEWYRSAYCKSSMYGIPFEGQDYCNDNRQGGMRGYLAKVFKIFETCDAETYRAGLISWMIESIILNPGSMFSEYVCYEELDNNHVKATVTYNGVSGSGILYISEEGQVTDFYSDERQIEIIDGIKTQIGWRCEAKNYVLNGALKMPQVIRAIKVYPDKEVVYFDASEYEIVNVK